MKRILILVLALAMGLSCATAAHAQSIDISENITLRIMTQSLPQTIDCADMPMWQNAAKEANVAIEWDQIRSGWEEKKAVVLASNDLPDLFLGGVIDGGGLSDGDITTNIDAFVELSDLIAAYAPNVTKMFEENRGAKVAATFTDGIYSIPMVLGFMPKSCITMMINKNWLDQVGLEVPTTLDELEQALIAFRDNDLNGNGIQDEIPLDWPAVQHGHDIYALTGAWGVVDNLDSDMPVVIDGKVSFLYETEAFYNLTVYLHKLYAQGLINPEVYTNEYAMAAALSAQGEVARVGVTTGWSIDGRVGQHKDQYVILQPLKASADSDIKPVWPTNPYMLNASPNAVVMTKACQYPERAMVLINLLYTDEFSVQNYYGSIPDYIAKHDDGTFEILAPADGSTIETSKWINALVNYGPGNFSADLQSRVKAPFEIMSRLEQDAMYDDFRPVQTDIYPSVKYSAEENEELVYLKTDIHKLVKQKMAEWCVNGGIENEWEGYLTNLNNMGLERMREIYQNAYENFFAD